MFQKLMPDQVGKFWNLIKPGLLRSDNNLAGSNLTICNNILKNAIAGKITIWLGFNWPKYIGFIITSINIDPFNEERFLLIYLAYAYSEVGDELAQQIYSALSIFAQGNHCTSIKAYAEPGLEVLLKRYWGNIFQTKVFLNFNL
jgi:hypothetical protein